MKCRLLMMQRIIISLSNLTVLFIPNYMIIKIKNSKTQTLRLSDCLIFSVKILTQSHY